MKTGAAELIAILHDEGIGHLFVDPGMHTAPLREALAEASAAAMPHPQPVLCVHEHVALSAAHGHHLAGGGPEAVMVHVESGHLNLRSAVAHAQRDRVPVAVFCGSRAECRSLMAERPEWPARQPHEPALLGSTCKWAADLSGASEPCMLVRRAFQIARSEPAGLTLVALPTELMGRSVPHVSRRLTPPRTPAPDESALYEMAELLATAEWPLIVAGRVGRHPAAVHHLATLAEVLGAPVIDIRNNVNMPPGHPLNAGLEGKDLLERADAILLLDVDVTCVPGLGPLPAGAWLFQIDIDCLKADRPDWAYPVEIAVTANTEAALPALTSLLGDRLSTRRRRAQDRRTRLERMLRATHVSWRDRAASSDPRDRADAVLAELNRFLPEDAIVLEEVIHGCGSTLRQLARPPGHLFRSRATSPGWAVSAALGARLARPGQAVVALCDESAFAHGLPSAAFWSAHRAGAPLLTVVLDRAGASGAMPDGDPELDVLTIARESGAEAIAVTGPAEVAGALDRLLATTRDGVCAVMDVKLPGPVQEAEYRPAPVRRRNPLTSASTATRRPVP